MVARRDIQKFADAIAREFKPKRIVLFGSHACGQPAHDSDVDLLVVMPYQGHPTEKAIEIRKRIPRSFALDLLVRSQPEIDRRVTMNDWFIREIVEQGKVLYEADDQGVGRKGRERLSQRRPRDARPKGAKL